MDTKINKEERTKRPDVTTLNGDVIMSRTDYCNQLRQWMWQYYSGYANLQSWMMMMMMPLAPCYPPQPGTETSGSPSTSPDITNWYIQLSSPSQVNTATAHHSGSSSTAPATTVGPAQADGNTAHQAGREYTIPSPLHRFLAELVDFFILFCVKATIVLWILHLSGMNNISKVVIQFVVEEIDENTSLEDLQKMMIVALVYRVLVCIYEIICIWGAGGATPGKFLLGLRVIACDSTVMVRPNRVLVVPASNVTLSASTVRALNKNLSIAFLFPVFITLLFFQHNRTVYDIVAGTIVVRRRVVR